MWICMNNAYLSIVDPAKAPGSAPKGTLLVRARMPGHIEAVFPLAKVRKTPDRDYLYRAYIPRRLVSMTIAEAIWDIGYGNFKDSVEDRAMHDAYARVWGVMNSVQDGGRYNRGRRRDPRNDDLLPLY